MRPFKDRIDWDEISFYVKNVEELDDLFTIDKGRLLEMGLRAKDVYYNKLNYGKWCRYVIEALCRIDGISVDIDAHAPSNKGIKEMFRGIFNKYR